MESRFKEVEKMLENGNKLGRLELDSDNYRNLSETS